MATTATPTSFSEALTLNLGIEDDDTLAVATTLVAFVAVAFKAVNDGMATAVEVTVAIFFYKSLFLCYVLEEDQKGKIEGVIFYRWKCG